MGKSSEGKLPQGVGKRLVAVVVALFFLFPLVALIFGKGSDLSSRLSRGDRENVAIARHVRSPREEDEVKTLLAESRDHLAREEATRALVPLARVVSLAPELAEAHNNLCVAYGILKQRRAAVGECTEALRLRPSFQLAQNNLKWVSSLPGPTDSSRGFAGDRE